MSKWRGVGIVLVVAVIALVLHAATGDPHGTLALGGKSGALLGSLRIWGQPLSKADLIRASQPENQPIESFPYIFYDTQTYPAAGVASLNFFTALSSDLTITNMAAAGQFPSPQYFQPFGFAITFMVPGPSNITVGASGTNSTGLINDMDLIMKKQRAIFNFSLSQKVYAQWPALALHCLGGAQVFQALASVTLNNQYANNGPVDGGFGHQGEIVIPPNTGFQCSLQLAAAQVITVDTPIQVAMIGRFYRKVL